MGGFFTMGVNEAKTAILENRTALGIEFGSTRIKAVLVDDKNQPIASGAYELGESVCGWYLDIQPGGDLGKVSRAVTRIWQKMFSKKYGVELTSVGAFGVSAMMHGYMPV